MEQMFVGGTCAACECLLLHGLNGQEIVQFSCGHEVHEACLHNEFEDEDEDEEMFCPACDAPLDEGSSDDSSDDGSCTDSCEATPDTTEIVMAELTSEDAVVAVLGPVGAGKSFFVRAATRDESIQVGKILEPITDRFSAHRTEIDGKSVVLIDTIGFDDTHQSHTDVLRTLAIWLAEMDVKDVHLAGVIYMHDKRSSQSVSASQRNLRVLRRLAGETAPKKVVFVRNCWEESNFSADEDEVTASSGNLKMHDYNVRRGIQMQQFAGDGEDARRILRSVIEDGNATALDLQRDLWDGNLSSLEQTNNSLWTRDKNEIIQLRIEFEEMLRSIRFEMSGRISRQPSWPDEQSEEQDYQISEFELQYDGHEELRLVDADSLRSTEHLVGYQLENMSSVYSSSIEGFTPSIDASPMNSEYRRSDTAIYVLSTIAISLIRLWEILQKTPSELLHGMPFAAVEEDEEEEWKEEPYLHIPCSFDEPPLHDIPFPQYLYSSTPQQEEETWAVRLPWRLRPRLGRIASEGDLYLKQHPDWFLYIGLMFFYLFLNGLVIGVYFWRRNDNLKEVDIRAW